MLPGSGAALPRRSLALALGPGGTRGFAHLGVINVLLDAGLRVDGICGASSGALFGALYAMDGTSRGVARAMGVSRREIWGLFRDRLRLAPSNPLGARLVEFFAGARLESLPVPMNILAVDLQSGDEIVLREGSVRAAVEASIAIPVLAQPVALDGRFLIDGGYGRRGPTVGARELGDVVVAVTLGEFGLPARLHTLARQIAHRLRRTGRTDGVDRRLVLRRAILALTAGEYDEPDADIVIAPRVGDINPNSPFVREAAFGRGARAAREALPAIRELLGRTQGAGPRTHAI